MSSNSINNNPIFSIITVSLNAGDNLLNTINSVIEQSFIDFEIIIKDGVSTDGSLLNLPNDSRIRIFIQNDSGIYDAMNKSLQYVNGKFLVFLNAGDLLYDKNILQHIYDNTIKHKEIGLFYCDYIATDILMRVNSPIHINSFTLFRNMLCHQCCFFKVDQFHKTGIFDLKYKVVSDYDFLVRFIINNKNSYHHINLLGIKYLSGGFSYTSKSIIEKEVSIIRKRYFGINYYLYLLILNLTLPSLRRKIYYSENRFLKKLLLFFTNIVNRA